MTGALPPMDLDLLCTPLTRGDSRPGRLLALVEEVVGQRLEVEFTPYAKLRGYDDREDLIDRAFFGQLWADREIMFVEGRAQTFCAFLHGSVRSEGRAPDDVTYSLFHMGILLPVDLALADAMALMHRLVGVGGVHVGRLGSFVEGQRGIGEYAFRDLWPHKCTLSWINAWSSTLAEHLGFPDADDNQNLCQVDRAPTSGAYVCALTEDRLDPARADHAEVIAWARRRFCQADVRQS